MEYTFHFWVTNLPLLISELATLTLLEVDWAGLLIPTAGIPLVFVGIDVI